MDKLMVARGPERQIVHSAAVVVRLRDSGHHGHARHRKSPRSADDDPRRTADELQRPAAGLHGADRARSFPSRLPWADSCSCRALTLLSHVSAGHGHRGRRGAGAQADAAARADAAVRDGAAELQVAVAQDRVASHVRSRLVVRARAGHADPGRGIVVWAASYYPHRADAVERLARHRARMPWRSVWTGCPPIHAEPAGAR